MIYFKHLITTRLIFHIILIVMLAFNLASHSNEIWPQDGWYGRCLYWFVRLMLESLLFLGSFYLIWQLLRRQMPLLCMFLGFLLSWVVFVLAITMIDISLGRDELGGIDLNNHQLVFSGMFKESLWILPKHIAFCLLIILINFRIDYGTWFKLNISEPTEDLVTGSDDSMANHTNSGMDLLLEKLPKSIRATPIRIQAQEHYVRVLPKSIRATPIRIQAQEHYVRVTTKKGTDLILYRFGNMLKELPEELGLQVHRSYWVARKNVKGWKQENNGILLQLFYGEDVPVSRRYEGTVMNEFSEH